MLRNPVEDRPDGQVGIIGHFKYKVFLTLQDRRGPPLQAPSRTTRNTASEALDVRSTPLPHFLVWF